jgi:quercetin dioxygenase-like cupin family protein
MKPIQIKDLAPREIVPGYKARFVHSEHLTLAYWTIEAGAELPSHNHPHEQIANLLEGEFDLTLDGTVHRLTVGEVLVIPSSAEHSGIARTDCRILDVFHPRREDYID